MTTCREMTFERLLAHIQQPDGDLAVLVHVTGCVQCSARIIAVRMQSLALASLARQRLSDPRPAHPRRDPGRDLECRIDLEAPETLNNLDGFSETDDFEVLGEFNGFTDLGEDDEFDDIDELDAFDELMSLEEFEASSDSWNNDDTGLERAVDTHDTLMGAAFRGPGACLGAARDAGLASFHWRLRELLAACLWNASPTTLGPLLPAPPRSLGEIAPDIESLARRLRGLGLTLETDDLPGVMPSADQRQAVARHILGRIVAIEGHSSWVEHAESLLRQGR